LNCRAIAVKHFQNKPNTIPSIFERELRVRRFQFVPALILLIGIITQASAQDGKVSFAWKFEKDKSFFQEMTTRTTQSLKVSGMDVNQVQEQTFYFKWTPLKQDGDKWILEQSIEAVKMKIDIAGNPISFDSTQANAAAGTNTALSEFFKAMVGTKFTLTLNKQNKVEKVEGQAEFLKKLANANSQMEPILKKILSDEAMKQMADPTFGITPSEPKKKDETWQNKMTLNLGPIGTYENTYSFKYLGLDDKTKLDKIEVTTALTYKAPTEGGEGLPFKIKSATLKSDEKQTPGSILFNSATGRVESSESKIKLKGNLKIEIGGTETTVDLQQDQETIVKTSEKSFVAEKK
jgi:hypothetical protein